jgi:type IV secretory pathway TraG/TraD family ATPase VirD4
MSIFSFHLYKIFGLYKDIHGSASFLSGFEKWRFLNRRKDGLVIDGKKRISLERSFRHLLLIAPTGSGKTTSYIIPNILNLKDTSAVVTDPSGEIYQKTAGYMRTQGFHIKVINVRDLEHSLKFNPLHRANTHTEIKKVSDVLVNSAFSDSRGDQQFWNDGAKNIINILIRCLKQESIEYQNLHNLRHLLNSFGCDGTPLNSFIARNTENDQATFNEFKGFISNDDKVIQGAVATAKIALDKFSDPEMCSLTAKETLNFESLRKEKTVLYLIIPEHEIKYYGFFLSLLYSQLFSFSMESEKEGERYLPIFFLLDEFGNTGAIPNFSSLITTLRKRNCSCSIVLQDIEQLTHTYGRADASTIVNGGCSSRIYFPGLSLQSCEELERILGRSTVRYIESGTHKIGEETDTARDATIGRSLLTSDEIRTMNDDEALFIHSNLRPVMLRITPYYRSRALLRKTKIKPLELHFHSQKMNQNEYLNL